MCLLATPFSLLFFVYIARAEMASRVKFEPAIVENCVHFTACSTKARTPVAGTSAAAAAVPTYPSSSDDFSNGVGSSDFSSDEDVPIQRPQMSTSAGGIVSF